MMLCSDEIYWGEIRATNLPPRHHTTATYLYSDKDKEKTYPGYTHVYACFQLK